MQKFDLQNFLPFRLSRLSFEVSTRMAEIYSERFDIGIPEWRILATLAAKEPCTAQTIVASTRTHKSTISRSVARLEKNGWIEQISTRGDRRKHLLQMTEEGRNKFSKLVPLVQKFEQDLRAKLGEKEIGDLINGIDELERVLGLGQANKQKDLDL